MAYLNETFEMFLSGLLVKVAKGHVAVLYRGERLEENALAHIRVNTLEEANALETIAVTSAVYGRWEPNYLFEGKALSVSEFGALVAKDPAKFADPQLKGSAAVLAAVSPKVREGMLESLEAIGVKPKAAR